jgi:type I restriction enzyme R subunit
LTDFSSEADARILVDEMLRLVGWDPADKSQVLTEVPVKMTDEGIAEPGASYAGQPVSTQSGRIDYVLLDQRGRHLAVIEAKRAGINPYSAKQQALPYARTNKAPFIFLTNGDLIYFWDYENDDARIINSFYSRRDLERLVEMRAGQKPMAEVEVPEFYLRQGENRRLRPYQREAMKAMDHALELGKQRFLIELPTGTGKTDLIVLQLKRLIEASRAERVLFLVDRDQLAKQAIEAIQDILTQHSSYWLRSGMAKQEQQITVCLLQTMIGRYHEFSSGYFDVVIADECHRSIYGTWQTALTHFDAFHIGLTATPSAYIERNTFEFYQCKEEKPDYTYDIREAFTEGYLIPYKFATGITVLLTEGAEVNNEEYDPVQFEKQWTNEKTNRLMMEEFDKLAWENYRELAPGQKDGPGKAIVFAITKHHASRLAEYLNDLHPEHKGRYAEVITSEVSDADALIRKFKYEKYPMVAVSVGMLDTGFDCREVLHLVMARRVRSPILYQQMRGRGTRTAGHIDKQKFVIYDFFENHKYFNDDDEDIFTGASGGYGPGKPKKPGEKPRELVELGMDDTWMYRVSYIEVGPEGERVDKKEYITTWEELISEELDDDPIIAKVRKDEDLSDDEERELGERLNRPKMYYNEEKLRYAYDQPAGNIIDFIKQALKLKKVKSREEVLTENFQAWLVTKSLSPQQAQYLSLIKNRGIARGGISVSDLFQPPLSILNAAALGVELFGEAGLKNIIDDMNTTVFHRAGGVA